MNVLANVLVRHIANEMDLSMAKTKHLITVLYNTIDTDGCEDLSYLYSKNHERSAEYNYNNEEIFNVSHQEHVTQPVVEVEKIDENAVIPEYQMPGDAGFDFHASQYTVIEPGETDIIKTGLRVAIPEGMTLFVVPRSGISLNTQIRIANAPGTIDSGYRGEVGIIAENTGDKPFEVDQGIRLAQGIVLDIPQAEFVEQDSLSDTERGAGGFGSTGS